VDAYDGMPELYVVDPNDPMTQCYRRVFPTLFKDGAQMTPTIRQHLRYPQLLFMIQAQMYAEYHMKDANSFYKRADMWSMPKELYAEGQRMMEPYYTIMKLPGEAKEEFLMMLPFTPAGREERNMVAWMAARCDGEHYGKLFLYLFPKSTELAGPLQAEAKISQDPVISPQFSLWGQVGSRIIRGNLLVIPVENSILYVEPIYIEAHEPGEATQSSIPQLQAVVVIYEDHIAMRDTLEQALSVIFGTKAPPVTETAAGTPFTPKPTGAPVTGTARELLQKAIALGAEAETLLRQGDLAGYQQKNREQEQLLKQLAGTMQWQP
jgi:uncharacterized protein